MRLTFARLVRKDLGASFHDFHPYSLLGSQRNSIFLFGLYYYRSKETSSLQPSNSHLYACHPTQNNCMIEQESCTQCVVAHHVLSHVIQTFMATSSENGARAPAPKSQRIGPSLLQEVARLPLKKRSVIDSPFNALTSKLQTSNKPPQQSSNSVSYYPHLETGAFTVCENTEKAAYTRSLAMV